MHPRTFPRSIAPTLLVAALVVGAVSACSAPPNSGVLVRHILAPQERCSGTYNITKVRTKPGIYDIRVWEYARVNYPLPVRLDNVLLPNARINRNRGEGNYRDITGFEVRWQAPKGWGVSLPTVFQPYSFRLDPLAKANPEVPIVSDEIIQALITDAYTDPNLGRTCVVGSGDASDDPSLQACANVLTEFKVTVRAKMLTPNGEEVFSNGASFVLNVCRGCTFTDGDVVPDTFKSRCCTGTPAKDAPLPTLSSAVPLPSRIDPITGRSDYDVLKDAEICHPFIDNPRVKREWFSDSKAILGCFSCRCGVNCPVAP